MRRPELRRIFFVFFHMAFIRTDNNHKAGRLARWSEQSSTPLYSVEALKTYDTIRAQINLRALPRVTNGSVVLVLEERYALSSKDIPGATHFCRVIFQNHIGLLFENGLEMINV
jgi:hypothetical protein